MELASLDNGVILHRVTSLEDIDRWRRPFAKAYRAVFRGEPYLEEFSIEKAEGVFRHLTGIPDNITLIAADGEEVLGFGVAVPLAAMQTIAPRLAGLVPPRHTYYLAELGVVPTARKAGLGRTLIRERIRLMDPERYSHVVLRVSEKANRSAAMYESLGFEDMGVTMDVTRTRTDGTTRSDRRRFLCRLLSQVDVA